MNTNFHQVIFIYFCRDVERNADFAFLQFVGATFWSLMMVDRELVLPKAMDPYFPWWLNHLMHTIIVITTVIEMIIIPRQYPKRSRGLGILAIFMLTYLIW